MTVSVILSPLSTRVSFISVGLSGSGEADNNSHNVMSKSWDYRTTVVEFGLSVLSLLLSLLMNQSVNDTVAHFGKISDYRTVNKEWT